MEYWTNKLTFPAYFHSVSTLYPAYFPLHFYIFLLLEKSRKSRKSRGKNPAGIGTEEIPNPAGRDSGFYTSSSTTVKFRGDKCWNNVQSRTLGFSFLPPEGKVMDWPGKTYWTVLKGFEGVGVEGTGDLPDLHGEGPGPVRPTTPTPVTKTCPLAASRAPGTTPYRHNIHKNDHHVKPDFLVRVPDLYDRRRRRRRQKRARQRQHPARAPETTLYRHTYYT